VRYDMISTGFHFTI